MWESLFEGIKLKYVYDTITEYHIVEVKPEEIRRGNTDYKKVEMQLWMDFMKQYPDECLLICGTSDVNDKYDVTKDDVIEEAYQMYKDEKIINSI